MSKQFPFSTFMDKAPGTHEALRENKKLAQQVLVEAVSNFTTVCNAATHADDRVYGALDAITKPLLAFMVAFERAGLFSKITPRRDIGELLVSFGMKEGAYLDVAVQNAYHAALVALAAKEGDEGVKKDDVAPAHIDPAVTPATRGAVDNIVPGSLDQ